MSTLFPSIPRPLTGLQAIMEQRLLQQVNNLILDNDIVLDVVSVLKSVPKRQF